MIEFLQANSRRSSPKSTTFPSRECFICSLSSVTAGQDNGPASGKTTRTTSCTGACSPGRKMRHTLGPVSVFRQMMQVTKRRSHEHMGKRLYHRHHPFAIRFFSASSILRRVHGGVSGRSRIFSAVIQRTPATSSGSPMVGSPLL